MCLGSPLRLQEFVESGGGDPYLMLHFNMPCDSRTVEAYDQIFCPQHRSDPTYSWKSFPTEEEAPRCMASYVLVVIRDIFLKSFVSDSACAL